MDKDDAEKRSDALARTPLGGGRLGTYTMLGAADHIRPIPRSI